MLVSSAKGIFKVSKCTLFISTKMQVKFEKLQRALELVQRKLMNDEETGKYNK
jgi:hypothetical protein